MQSVAQFQALQRVRGHLAKRGSVLCKARSISFQALQRVRGQLATDASRIGRRQEQFQALQRVRGLGALVAGVLARRDEDVSSPPAGTRPASHYIPDYQRKWVWFQALQRVRGLGARESRPGIRPTIICFKPSSGYAAWEP